MPKRFKKSIVINKAARYIDGLSKQIQEEFQGPQGKRKLITISSFLIFLLIFGVIFSTLRPSDIKHIKATSGDVILLWDTANGSVPAGWTCISCSGGQDFYGVFPRAAATYGGSTSGADTHNSHAMAFLAQQFGADDNTCIDDVGTTGPSENTHNHGTWPSPTLGTGDVKPAYAHLNLILRNGPTVIPDDTIAIFDDASLPTGWTRYSALDNNYLRGYSDNGTGGSSTHAHTTSLLTSPNDTATLVDIGNGNTAADDGHNHEVDAASLDVGINAPPYVEVIFAYNSSGSDISIPGGMIAMFNDTPTTNWTTVSSGAPFQNNFLVGNTTYGSTGGSSADHNHGALWAPISTEPSITDSFSKRGTNRCAHDTHTHELNYSVGNDASMPVYRDVILAKRDAIITVDVEGTQVTPLSIPSTDNYIGGAFTVIRNTGVSIITSINISETGSVDAQNDLSNVDIRYETAGTCTYDTGEPLFGTAQFDASQDATVLGAMAVSTDQICVYVILDVDDTANDLDEVEIEITDPSNEVISPATAVEPDTIKAITDTTVLTGNMNPNDPTSLGPGAYVDGTWVTDNTPTLNMDCTDDDGGNDVKYRINIDDDSDFSADLIVDYSSVLGSQGTVYFTVGQAEGGGTYFDGGESQTLADSSGAGGYYWRVKCIDDSAAESAWVEAGSDGVIDFKVDATAPTGGTVNDGAGADIDWNNGSLVAMEANWSGFNFDTSGIDKYDYGFRRSSDGWWWETAGPSWQSGSYWIDNGTTTTASFANLDLNTSDSYYFTVQATDNAGNTASPVDSDGQRVLPQITFVLNTTIITFDDLNTSNNHLNKKTSTVTTSTNAYSGYSVYASITQLLTSVAYPSQTIPNFADGSYGTPSLWPDIQCTATDCGFGYTSSDTTIGVGKGNKFLNATLYAPFSLIAPGDVVADYVDPIDGGTGELVSDAYTITYKVSTLASQTSTKYYNQVTYITTATF